MSFQTGGIYDVVIKGLGGSPAPSTGLDALVPILLVVFLIGPFVWPVAIAGLGIAAIDAFLLVRLSHNWREWRWPSWVYAAILGAGLLCGFIVLKLILESTGK